MDDRQQRVCSSQQRADYRHPQVTNNPFGIKFFSTKYLVRELVMSSGWILFAWPLLLQNLSFARSSDS